MKNHPHGFRSICPAKLVVVVETLEQAALSDTLPGRAIAWAF
jgi:hypothetical protein